MGGYRCRLIVESSVLLLLLLGCAATPQPTSTSQGWTAIVAAYAPEMAAIDQAIAAHPDAKITSEQTHRGVHYQLGTFAGTPIVIFASGVSVTNAAMTMQMAIDRFPIDHVIMMGIAGAVDPQLQPGDIEVPARWYYHDESVYVNLPQQRKGKPILPAYYQTQWAQWQRRQQVNLPAYQPFDFIYPNEVSVRKDGWSTPRKQPYFAANRALLAMVKRAASRTSITMPSGRDVQVVVGGNGVTGSVFVDNARYRQWLRTVYHADVAEMESAAVGQVCFVNDVPWVVIRSVSDLAGAQQGQNTEEVFDGVASGTAAKLLMGVLEQLASTP